MNPYFKLFAFFLILVLFVFPQNAYAYLDPGSGSYLLQLLVAAFVSGIFVIKMFFGHIKSFFSGKKKTPENDPPPKS